MTIKVEKLQGVCPLHEPGQTVANLVHASGTREEAAYELDLWFDAAELFDYQTLAERYTC